MKYRNNSTDFKNIEQFFLIYYNPSPYRPVLVCQLNHLNNFKECRISKPIALGSVVLNILII